MSSDYCTWEGVMCDHKTGDVIELDLTCSQLVGAIFPNSTLFQLSHLQSLNLFKNNFSHSNQFPVEFGFFAKGLTHLNLSHTGFRGRVPSGISYLYKLVSLDLSLDFRFSYLFPIQLEYEVFELLLHNLTQLRVLNLESVQINSVLPMNMSTSLRVLNLRHTYLYGVVPQEIFHLPNLEVLNLSGNFDLTANGLTATLPKVKWGSSGSLQHLILDGMLNIYEGIPDSTVRSTSMATLPPNLFYLDLSSCQMKEFPYISGESKFITYVDLSNNQIEGEIPHWIGSVGTTYSWEVVYLNLSHNRITGGLEKLPWNDIEYLDLQFNMFSGSLPSLICNSSSLQILNLSHNNLSGVLPICPTNLLNLMVFDLRMNNIQGNLPSTLSNFPMLRTLNLHGNKLQGRVPSSFAEFEWLEVLDLGSNRMSDTFPQCLEALPVLQILVLRSNKFYGHINKSSKIEHPFPGLRILDLSYNEFSGPLPTIYFKNFQAMMDGDVNKKNATYMGDFFSQVSYSDSTALVIKGVEIDLVRILNVFTTIDVSSNNFEGEIVECIGNLVSLRYLNLSHNHLTGHIPSAIGKLSMLESLDLSFNWLKGEIPPQFTNISFLSLLNMSQNQLSGHIPKGPQFDTFDNNSYVGNLGLCGYPLSKECGNDIGIQEEKDEDDDNFFSGFTWEAVVIGYGCGVVPAFFIGYSMLLARKPKWFAGIIARELGLKVRRMELRMR